MRPWPESACAQGMEGAECWGRPQVSGSSHAAQTPGTSQVPTRGPPEASSRGPTEVTTITPLFSDLREARSKRDAGWALAKQGRRASRGGRQGRATAGALATFKLRGSPWAPKPLPGPAVPQTRVQEPEQYGVASNERLPGTAALRPGTASPEDHQRLSPHWDPVTWKMLSCWDPQQTQTATQDKAATASWTSSVSQTPAHSAARASWPIETD